MELLFTVVGAVLSVVLGVLWFVRGKKWVIGVGVFGVLCYGPQLAKAVPGLPLDYTSSLAVSGKPPFWGLIAATVVYFLGARASEKVRMAVATSAGLAVTLVVLVVVGVPEIDLSSPFSGLNRATITMRGVVAAYCVAVWSSYLVVALFSRAPKP